MTDWMEELQSRLAIEKVLRRYARAVDRADPDIVREVFHPDAELVRAGPDGVTTKTLDEWFEESDRSGWRDPERRIATSHFLSNFTIEFDESGDVAWTETYLFAMSRRPVEGRIEDWTFGGRYLDRFERRDGEWKILRRKLVEDWSRIDEVGRTWPERPAEMRGQRGIYAHLDPVYTPL